MKKFLLLIPVCTLFLLFYSCASKRMIINRDEAITVSLLDFSKFTEMGVIISPYSCANKKYTPIGDVVVEYSPKITTVNIPSQDPYISRKERQYHVDETPLFGAVYEMVNEVLEKGGNAIFDFKYYYEIEEESTGFGFPPLAYSKLIVKGFAVKLHE